MSKSSKSKASTAPHSKKQKAVKGVAEDLSKLVGQNLRSLRTKRELSLDGLANLSGVSRAMLGQIETGKSVPTISLLWKVASALQVPFSSLLASNEGSGTVVLRKLNAKVLQSSEGSFISRALFPFEEDRRVEFYELVIAAGHTEDAEAHASGTVENLVVAEGSLDVHFQLSGDFTSLGEGDAIRFRADVPHAYVNAGKKAAKIYLVMSYAQKTGFGV